MRTLLFIRYCFILAGLFLLHPVFGQKGRFHYGIGGGVALSPIPIKAGPLVRPLLGFPDQGGFFIIDVHYRWKNRIGIGFTFRLLTPPKHPIESFSKGIEQTFPNEYATIKVNGLNYIQETEGASQGLLFGSYTFLKQKWSIQPRVMFGLTSYPFLEADVVLKQPNTNEQRLLSLKKVGLDTLPYNERPTFGLGCFVERGLTRRFSLFACADFTNFRNKAKYQQRIENQIDGSQEVTLLEDTTPVFMFNLSAGLLIHWARRGRKAAR